jgi:hypothetical protein
VKNDRTKTATAATEPRSRENLETVPPPFDPDQYARESESTMATSPPSQKPTSPPEPFYAELRESCSSTHMPAAAPVDPEEAPSPPSVDWTSEVRVAEKPTGPVSYPTLDAVPRLVVSAEDLSWFDLDPEARAIVDRVNGARTIAEIADGMATPALEVRLLLQELQEAGAIEFA